MRRVLGPVCAALAAAGLLLGLAAGQASASTVHCGGAVAQSVKLDRDLTNCPGDGLVVDAPNITIDLNGHTISGSGTGSGIRNASIPTEPYAYPDSDYVGVTVENGSIRGFPRAIYSVADGQTFRRLTVDGRIDSCCFGRHGYSSPNGGRLLASHVVGLASMGRTAVVAGNRFESGLEVGSGVVAHNVVHGGLGQYGTIVARNGPLDIEDNVISGSQGSGIGLVGSVGSRVERNTVYANRGSGVSIYSEVVVGVYTIVRNRIYANGGDGIHAEGDVSEQVSNNRIFRNAGSGVHVDYTGWDNPDSTGVSGSAHRYLRNLVYLNGGAGIEAANYRSPLVLRGNSADRNGADGIHVGAGTIHDENPSWSPDGRHIAFQSDRAGSEDLFVANSDGAGVRRLTTDPAADTNPQWSPDGSTIAFESAQRGAIGLYTINPDGSGLHKLADLGPEDPGFSWSPDGKRIAFGGDFLYVVNADGTGLRQVSDLPSAADPTWSPNGTQVAFQQTRTMPDSTFEAQWLIVVNVDSSDTTPFSTFPGNIDPSWSPDGTKIALNGITTVNADGSDLPFGTDLTPGRHPQWSPDGKQLTFESDRGARLTDVFVANSNGSGRTNVTNSALYAETRPVWSPDGSRIAYNVSGPGIDEVDMIRPDGSGRTSIVNDFPATITANSADRNHALGIDVVPGVADGGGNSARQNGDPRQCLGIECRP